MEYLKEGAFRENRETRAIVELLLDYTDFVSETAFSASEELDTLSNLDIISTSPRFTDIVATFENESFKLDGSVTLPIKTEKYGYWSENRTDEDGNISPVRLSIDLSNENVGDNISIVFGQEQRPLTVNLKSGDYEVELNVESDVLIFPTTELGDSLDIEFTNWNNTDSHIKINKVDLGATKLYGGDDIMKLNIIEETDLMGLYIPSNEATITVQNLEDEFNILNKGGYYQYLSQEPTVRVYLGHNTNNGWLYERMGAYVLDSFVQNDYELTLTAKDIITKLDRVTYYGLKSILNINNIKDILSAISLELGLNVWKIDENLNTLDLFYAGIPGAGFVDLKPLTGREMLTKLAVYYGINIWVDRDGIINYGYFNDKWTQYFAPRTPTGEIISLDQSYKEPRIEENEMLKTVIWEANNRFLSEETRQVLDVLTYTVNSHGVNALLEIPTASYINVPIAVDLAVTGSVAINSIYSDGFLIGIRYFGEGTITVGFNDLVSEIYLGSNRQISDSNLISLYDELGLDVSSIFKSRGYALQLSMGRIFDTNVAVAPDGYFPQIILWLFEKSKRLNYECDWRGYIGNKLGDIVFVDNKYGDYKKIIITRQEFTYDGALRVITKGQGDL